MTRLKIIIYLAILVSILGIMGSCAPGPPPSRPGEGLASDGDAMADLIASSPSDFPLTSPVMQNGGVLPVNFTCDGESLTPPLTWAQAPEGTVSYAILMDHQPVPGDYHWYWIAFGIPADVDSLPAGAIVPGTLGTNSVNDRQEYAPPCSKGSGEKLYTFHVYALSAVPEIADPASTDREALLASIEGITLATANLNVIFDRGNPISAEVP
ncbi:MAG: YbhB/YbcL family Raf kinase inhibitor-like protein [Anaerolineae bacterium]